MFLDPNNLRILILKRNFEKSLECRYLCNLKLEDTLYKYINYSKNEYINNIFYEDIYHIKSENNIIEELLDKLIVF